ncbi:hypothetical protein [Gordonia sp. NPDC058843]|uniref:hypothetical protein n=1 Tax=Gordonia sp. NPDC058843 TaxID=3346648 RepID=UPI003682F68D
MAHTLSGFRTPSQGPEVLDINENSPGTLVILAADGPARVVVPGTDRRAETFEAPGWELLDSFVKRFAPDVAADLSTRFAETVAEWEAAPTRVTYSAVNGRDVLIGLSYQTSPDEVLGAVWRGLCTSLVRVLNDAGIDVPVRVESDHPGTQVLVDRLRAFGVRVAGAADELVRDPAASHRLEVDRLALRVAAVAEGVTR